MSGFDGTVGDYEKRDLTDEDARELQLLQEKRRWFEGKLKVSWIGSDERTKDYADRLGTGRPSADLSVYLAYISTVSRGPDGLYLRERNGIWVPSALRGHPAYLAGRTRCSRRRRTGI